MTDLDVGIGTGEHGEFYTIPRAEICLDLFRPTQKMKEQFIQADAHFLPFKDKSFDRSFAFNVLEHVNDPYKSIKELQRVSSTVIIRQDKIWNIGNYACDSHLWFQLGSLKFIVRYPRTRFGILFAKFLHILMIKEFHGRFKILGFIRKCLTQSLNSEKYGQYISTWSNGRWSMNEDLYPYSRRAAEILLFIIAIGLTLFALLVRL